MSEVLPVTDAVLALEPETGTGALRLDLTRRLAAEALGTAFLIVAVIGSGIMASQLSPTDVGLQLLENAAASAGALVGLILMFGAVSGAHFNPVVTPRRCSSPCSSSAPSLRSGWSASSTPTPTRRPP